MTALTCTQAFQRFKARPFVRRSMYIGYAGRVLLSLAFPIGMFADMWPGVFSIAAVEAMGDGLDLPELKPWEHAWDNESPEATEVDEVHYLMTPYHVISIAMHHEKKAVEFFESVVENSADPKLREMAEGLAEEEREHVRLLGEWLVRYPKPEKGWDEDPDPPNLQE